MKMNKIKFYILTLFLLASTIAGQKCMAQNHANKSVLAEHTWYRLSVDKEGVFRLDYATLAAMGIDMENLNPSHIRIFGNESGSLPESNSDPRPDDLTEMAIHVSGADDGSFDQGDAVFFYGQEPTRWILNENSSKVYERERNYYTDSTYYYLCVDSGTNGLRTTTLESLSFDNVETIITEFPNFTWHEKELFTPYYIGRNWFGEMLTEQDTLLEITFNLPNLVKEKPVYVKVNLMARSLSIATRYNIWANDNLLVNNGSISSISPSYYYAYGSDTTIERQIHLESDTVQFSVQMRRNGNGNLMLLDYLEMAYWSQLKYTGKQFPFRLSPKQFGNGVSAVWVQDAGGCELWDVSNPLRPAMQQGSLSAGNFVFATNKKTERRYLMFDPENTFTIASWRPIANQNLHALTEADAIIFTVPMLWQQAQQLADFHLEHDGFTSLVVDVNEVYNEFSTGIPDPTALRDFTRMIYTRSQQRLKYVVLFGKASFDYRDILGYGNNFVPSYEEKFESERLSHSDCTDDYFGLMDPNEGKGASGSVDLGIGRIPVSTPEEADAALRKIFRSHDIALSHGEWKTNYLLVAGDEAVTFMEPCETADKMIDTMADAFNTRKIYTMAYPTEQTPAGVRVPKANAELVEAFNKGFLVMNYNGHGGVKGLTGVGLFSLSDYPHLNNHNRLPLVFTATCEFTKYDNPALISAGEQLFLLPDRGAAAMLTSSRPTFTQYNPQFSKSFMKAVFRRETNGKPLRYGDIVKAAKRDPINYPNSNLSARNNSIVYVFIGDPMLRFPLPEEDIATLKINGKNANTDTIELHAMSMVSVEGEIKNADGRTDTDFNGKLWLRLFDKPTTAYASGNKRYTHAKDVIHRSCATVQNGKFRVSFQIPAHINPDYGTARLSYYAYDSIRGIDAMGSFERLNLGGTDPAMMPDDMGPQISFYWNTPDFRDGDVVDRQGTLYADLYDPQGIYHYDFDLGRDIVLGSNYFAYNNLVLNDSYEPALDDFRRGRVAIPVSGLTEGTYEFSLRVWDTQNNVSTATLWFVVAGDVFLSGVTNYPNPFSEETNITIHHSGDEGNFLVKLEVFDALGRKVAMVEDRLSSHGESIGPLCWDGRDQFGNTLRSGLYLYRLTLTDENGQSRTVSQRMMIAR